MSNKKISIVTNLIIAIIYITAYILIMYNCKNDSDRNANGMILFFTFMAYLMLTNFVIMILSDKSEDNKKEKEVKLEYSEYDRNITLKKYAEYRIKDLNNYIMFNEREDDDAFFANKEKELFEIAYKALEESEESEDAD